MPETIFNLVLFFDTEELVGQTDHFMAWSAKKDFIFATFCWPHPWQDKFLSTNWGVSIYFAR